MRWRRPGTGTSPGTTGRGRRPAPTQTLRSISRPSSTAPSGSSVSKRVHRVTMLPGRPETTPEARRPPRNVPTRSPPTRGSCGPCVARASPPRPSRRSWARGTASAPPRGRPRARRGPRTTARSNRTRRNEATTTQSHERISRRNRRSVRRERRATAKRSRARFPRRFWRKSLLPSGDTAPSGDAALRGARSRLPKTRFSGRHALPGSCLCGRAPPPRRISRRRMNPISSPRRRSGTRRERRVRKNS
mmetsp:Transcript_14594/g.61555  ORF Transcript_14594/g.61555 Transcript_14594/m.61555 type:complete len:247 (+) Transcript_14594:111-851(+)